MLLSWIATCTSKNLQRSFVQSVGFVLCQDGHLFFLDTSCGNQPILSGFECITNAWTLVPSHHNGFYFECPPKCTPGNAWNMFRFWQLGIGFLSRCIRLVFWLTVSPPPTCVEQLTGDVSHCAMRPVLLCLIVGTLYLTCGAQSILAVKEKVAESRIIVTLDENSSIESWRCGVPRRCSEINVRFPLVKRVKHHVQLEHQHW